MIRPTIVSIRLAALACFLVAAAKGDALAQGVTDRIRTARGLETGEVTDMSPLEITISKGSSKRALAVNEIRSVNFAGEPSGLVQARVNASNGSYSNALGLLRKIDARAVDRDFIKQDIEFYKALSAAKLALGGNGEIADAGRQLNSFIRSNPQNYHYLEAVEAMGDLLMAAGKYENAEKQYAELAKAPWPEFKMRAAVAIGRSLQSQRKHTEAIQQFELALAMPGESAEEKSQKLSATLGKAVSLAEGGGVDEAVDVINNVIADADPEEKELHARAYIALGKCYEKGGKSKDALLAFLHVDVLYNTMPDAHAEALAHLVTLWQAVGQDQQAREARQILQDRYGGSRWAK